MSQISIPQYKLAEDSDKPHYVYVVQALDCGRYHRVEKRYSAFHCLHRELRKHYDTPDFPPKRVRNSNPKVLEQRRQGLENYLQAMLKFGPTRPHVLSFLGIQRPRGSIDSLDTLDGDKGLDHQPMFSYVKDPYVEVETNSKLPDIITKGLLMGLYGEQHWS